MVSGGLGLVRKVLSEVEIYNVNDNMWTEVGRMVNKRAGHSLFETSGGKYIYAYGGVDENSERLDSVERTKIDNPEGRGQWIWEVVDIKLKEPIVNSGII